MVLLIAILTILTILILKIEDSKGNFLNLTLLNQNKFLIFCGNN
jgi:hypothetical protein